MHNIAGILLFHFPGSLKLTESVYTVLCVCRCIGRLSSRGDSYYKVQYRAKCEDRWYYNGVSSHTYHYLNRVRLQLTHPSEEGGSWSWGDSSCAGIVPNIAITK